MKHTRLQNKHFRIFDTLKLSLALTRISNSTFTKYNFKDSNTKLCEHAKIIFDRIARFLRNNRNL